MATRATLADRYQGRRLNSPNDVVVKSDGSVYFTDPPYAVSAGLHRDEGWWQRMVPGKQLAVNGVYRLDPDGLLTLLVDDFALPNGLAFSPDEKSLYIDDSERRVIRVCDVRDDGTLANGRVLLDMASADAGVPDGMKVDGEGNIFCTGPGGLWVCRPSGELLGRVRFPELPANVAWGEDWNTLLVTARTSVYRLRHTGAGTAAAVEHRESHRRKHAQHVRNQPPTRARETPGGPGHLQGRVSPRPARARALLVKLPCRSSRMRRNELRAISRRTLLVGVLR
jgi:gluconolactonase